MVSGHAYSVLQAAEVPNANGEIAKVVKVRNPWGKFEWNGTWSDDSDVWSEEARGVLDHRGAANDGIFCMAFEDYI